MLIAAAVAERWDTVLQVLHAFVCLEQEAFGSSEIEISNTFPWVESDRVIKDG